MKRLIVILVFAFGLLLQNNLLAQTTPQTTFPFPQIAVGIDGSIEFVTTLILTNQSLSSATGVVLINSSGGNPLIVRITSLRTSQTLTGSSFNFTLPPSTTTIWELSSSGPVTSGWALISTSNVGGGNDVKISGTAAFVLLNRSGVVLSSAGVGATSFSREFYTPTVLRNPDLNTGIAVINFDSTSKTINFELFDSSGARRSTASRTLPGFGHTALFVNELFGLAIPSNIDIGMLKVTSSGFMAGVVLQFTGINMTTFPVIAVSPVSLSPETVGNLAGQLIQK